jgi:hypothetical protein
MQRQNPQWQEDEKRWENEWARACEIWEQMEDVVADPRFSADSTAPNPDSERDGIEMAAADPPGEQEVSERTWPMSPQMLAVETATSELLGLGEPVEPLDLIPGLGHPLARRVSDPESHTMGTPRYVRFPRHRLNPEPSVLPTSNPLVFKLIQIEEHDATIYDPPLQVIRGSNDHRTLAVICKLLDAEAVHTHEESMVNDVRAVLLLQIEMYLHSDAAQQRHVRKQNKPVIGRLRDIRERLKAAHTSTLYLTAAQARVRYETVDAYVDMKDWEDLEILLDDRD